MKRRFNGEVAKKVKKGTFLRLIKCLFKYKIRLTLIMIALFGSTIASVCTNLFLKIIIDDYITPLLKETGKLDFSPLLHAIIVFIGLLVIGAICTLVFQLLMVKLSNGVLRDLREKMYSKMEYFPLSYFDTNKAGDIMSKYTNDLDTLRQVISQAIPFSVFDFLTFIFIFISMITLSLNLFLVVVFMCIVMLICTKFASSYAIKNYKETQEAVAGLNSYVEEMVLGAKEVKVYTYESRNVDNFVAKNKKWREVITKADTVSNMMMPLLNGLGNVLYILIAFFGGLIITSRLPNFTILGKTTLTVGIISSFLSFTKTFSHTIAELSSQLTFIMQSLSGAERVFELIDTKVEIDDGHITLCNVINDNGKLIEKNENTNLWAWKDNEKLIPLVGNIVFENVNFSYVKDRPVLKNINVYANDGEKVALVGATGAGKTTITNLINRFYEIDSGKITYDGIDVKDIKKKDLRNSLALVLQDVNLFTGTILENIRYGKLDASDEECVNAAKLACAEPFINMLPDGYNTIIKGDGGGLSQGQRQLISIARAAVANAPCLILDEATSSIDTRTEKLVEKGMNSLMLGRTVFIIAHRLSTIKDSDVIMVMKDGEIIERGNHELLLAKKNYYFELYTGKIEID